MRLLLINFRNSWSYAVAISVQLLRQVPVHSRVAQVNALKTTALLSIYILYIVAGSGRCRAGSVPRFDSQ